MKENTETIIAMLEELLTVSKSRQASQSGCTNMDITSIKALIEEAGRRNHERTEAELAKFAHGIVDCLNTVNNRIDRIARGNSLISGKSENCWSRPSKRRAGQMSGTPSARPGTRSLLRTDGTGRLLSV